MSEQLLKAVLVVALGVVVWQIIAVRKDLSAERSEIAALKEQIQGLQQATEINAIGLKPPTAPPAPITPARAALRRLEQAANQQPATTTDSIEADRTLEEARWKDQQEALTELATQVQTLLRDVEAIGTAVETIGPAVVELRTGAQSIATDVTALGQEVARLNAALERMAGGG